jgi:hypothetical protein
MSLMMFTCLRISRQLKIPVRAPVPATPYRQTLAANYFRTMKTDVFVLGLLIFLLAIPFLASGQDSVTVDKKRIDKIVKEEIQKMESKYKDKYKQGRVTWTFPKSVAKNKLITVEIKLDGDTFLYYDYDPVTYRFMGGIDLR